MFQSLSLRTILEFENHHIGRSSDPVHFYFPGHVARKFLSLSNRKTYWSLRSDRQTVLHTRIGSAISPQRQDISYHFRRFIRQQSCADGRRAGVGGAHLPGAGAAHRVEPADVHPPRDLHHRVLGSLQAHGDGPRAGNPDPLRAGHA